MPSPFTQYTGEQVPQINILPYTQGIANSIQQGISDLGKGIGDVIGQYRQEQKMKETVTPLLMDEVGKYIRQDEKGKESLDDTAPTYIKDYYQQSLKEGGEEGWKIGATRVSASTVGSAWATHGEWQKNRELDFKLETQQREHDAIAFQQAMARQAVAEDETAKITTPVKQVQFYNPSTGEYSEAGKEADILNGIGASPDNVWTEEQAQKYKAQGTVDTPSIIGMSLTGDANWNAGTKFQDVSGNRDKSGNTSAYNLVNGVYKALQESGYPQAKLDATFRRPAKAGGTGVTSDVQVNEETYNKAVQLLGTNSVKSIFKNKGVNTDPVERAIPESVWIKRDMGTSQETETRIRHLNEIEIVGSKYDAVVSRWARNNPNAFIPSRQLMFASWGINQLPVVNIDGIPAYEIGGKGQYMPASTAKRYMASGVPIGAGEATVTAAGESKKEREAWLGQFSGKEGRSIGGGWSAKWTAGKQYAGNWDEDYKVYKTLPTFDLLNKSLDRMEVLNKDSRIKKFASVEWNQEWDNLNLTIQTARTMFIAGGQETDKDNERLASITGGQTWLRKLDPETMQKVLNATRAIVQAQVVGRMTSSGFEMSNNGKSGSMDAGSARAYLDSIIKKHS